MRCLCEVPLIGLFIQTVLPCIATFPARPPSLCSAAVKTLKPINCYRRAPRFLPNRERGNWASCRFYQTEASVLFLPGGLALALFTHGPSELLLTKTFLLSPRLVLPFRPRFWLGFCGRGRAPKRAVSSLHVVWDLP